MTEGIKIQYKKSRVVRHILPAGPLTVSVAIHAVVLASQETSAQAVKARNQALVLAQIALAFARAVPVKQKHPNDNQPKEHPMQNPPLIEPIQFIPAAKAPGEDEEIEVEPDRIIPTSTRPIYKGSRNIRRPMRHVLRQGDTVGV